MPQLKLYLFGSPRVELNDQVVDRLRRKVLAILAYLVVTQRPHRRDALATLLWPESGQQAARSALRREIHIINQKLGDGWLVTTRDSVSINLEANLWVDTVEFRKRLNESQNGAVSINGLIAAVELYQNDFLSDLTISGCLEFHDWHSVEANSLRGEYVNALSRLLRHYEEEDDLTSAITYARRQLALDLMHEPAHYELMRLFALAGQQSAALRQYRECERILKMELGVSPQEQTVELFESIRLRRFPNNGREKANREKANRERAKQEKGETKRDSNKPSLDPPLDPSPPQATSPSPPHNLPSQLTAFIGREADLVAIENLLLDSPECRLLTLLGPGGIGKTRLSLQIGHLIISSQRVVGGGSPTDNTMDPLHPFPDGVYFVPLAAISDVDYMVRAIGDAVNYRFQGNEEPQIQLEKFLGIKRLLLIIDNFEHLLDGADLLKAFLQQAPYLSVLVTSREALNVHEEWLYPVGGMTVPKSDAAHEQIAENSAVQLFVQRAQQAKREFALTEEIAPSVARICRLVDGMPLGLELAAAWVQAMTVVEIGDEIASNIDILASDRRNIPERHRSLRAVFEQTWQRLTKTERRTLSRLSVFRGSFTREAAQDVVDATLLDMASLVDKALCRQLSGRYDLHELLRQFAFERMNDDEQTAIQGEHSQYYCEILDMQHQYLMTSGEPGLLQAITDDFDNIVSAWHHRITQIVHTSSRDFANSPQSLTKEVHVYVELIRRCSPVLSNWFDRRALYWEGQRTFQRSVSLLRDAINHQPSISAHIQDAYVQLHIEQANFDMRLGHFLEVKSSLESFIPELKADGDRRQLAELYTCLGQTYCRLGEFVQAQSYSTEGLEIFGHLGLPLARTKALSILGMIANRRQQYDESRLYYEEAAAIYEEVGYVVGLALCMNNIGSAFSGQKETKQAILYYEKAYVFAQQSGHQNLLGTISCGLGGCAYDAGDYETSKEKYIQGLAIFRELNDIRWIAVTLADFSFTLIELNELTTATDNLYESLQLIQRYQLKADGIQALAATSLLLTRHKKYYLAAVLVTHVLDDDRLRARARRPCETCRDALKEQMTEQDFTRAQFHGRSTPFGKIVEEAIDAIS
ncbi:MAG: tetratricopeptide repeat protein [Chloroflexota bacterium]